MRGVRSRRQRALRVARRVALLRLHRREVACKRWVRLRALDADATQQRSQSLPTAPRLEHGEHIIHVVGVADSGISMQE